MSVSGGSDDSPASYSDHGSHSNHSGSHHDASSAQSMRSTQPLLDNTTSSSARTSSFASVDGSLRSFGGSGGGHYANKNNSNPRHVRFSEADQIVLEDPYDDTVFIRNPNVLIDGTDGTFV